MKIKHIRDIEGTVHDGGEARGVNIRVAVGQADGAPNFCMRVIEIAPGGQTPLHSHDWEHEVFIHEGQGAVLEGGEWVSLEVGNAIFIPSGEEHQFRNTGSEPLAIVCLIPRGAPES